MTRQYCEKPSLKWFILHKNKSESKRKCNMMQAQQTDMNQINYKKDHFDEINKKLNAEKYKCPSIALTAIALIWKWEKHVSFL